MGSAEAFCCSGGVSAATAKHASETAVIFQFFGIGAVMLLTDMPAVRFGDDPHTLI